MSHVKMMCHFLSQKDIVSNQPTRHKTTLRWGNEARKSLGDFSVKKLGQDLIGNIAEGDRSELRPGLGGVILRDKNDRCGREASGHRGAPEKIHDSFSDILCDSILAGLIEC